MRLAQYLSTMLRVLLIPLLLLPTWALADEIPAMEKQRALVEGHRARLEGLLGEQSKRIARLKAQPTGIQRDYQLAAALRENQSLADRLTKLRAQVRDLTQTLIKQHDVSLSRPGLSAAERSKLERRRAELAGALAAGSTRILTGGKASPLDTPDDLEEKADLLQDSEEKVRRQLRQVQSKITHLEQRARLERHAKAADDNPFVEDSPRRSGGARKLSSSGGDTHAVAPPAKSTAPPVVPSPPVPATPKPPSSESKANDPSRDTTDSFAGVAGVGASAPLPGGGGPSRAAGDTRGGPDTIISIREVLDPALLRDPTGTESRESLRGRIAALKKAGERLKQVAGKLSTQAGELRRRAKKLRTQH